MNTISSKQLLGRVFRLIKPVDAHWLHDALQSIDEAVQALGTKAFENVSFTLQAKNFRAALPVAAEYVNWVEVDGERVYHNSDIGLATDFGYSETMDGYKVEAGYIKTPKATCSLTVNCAVIPRDEEGLPLIPKGYEAMEAVFWYVVSHMLLQGYEIPGQNYDKAERRWRDFRGEAMNEMMMPTPDEYETTSRMWLGQNDVDINTLHNHFRMYPQTT